MGATPLSTPMTIRGKSVSGNTEIGMPRARKTPAPISVTIVKMIGFPCRAVQCSEFALASSLSLMVGGLFVILLAGLGGRLDLPLGAVLYADAAPRDDALARVDAFDDLSVVGV